jgi:hypothetical protein
VSGWWGVLFGFRENKRRFEDFYGFGYFKFAALIVVGGLAAVLVPWFLFAGPMIHVQGQVGLLPGDSAPHGLHGCSGRGRLADIRAGATLRVKPGNGYGGVRIGDGHLLASGRCEFQFGFTATTERGDYVFEIANVARWSLTNVDLNRPVELTVDRLSML